MIFSKSKFCRRIETILSDRRGRIKKLTRLALAGTVAAVILSIGLAAALPVGGSEKPDGLPHEVVQEQLEKGTLTVSGFAEAKKQAAKRIRSLRVRLRHREYLTGEGTDRKLMKDYEKTLTYSRRGGAKARLDVQGRYNPSHPEIPKDSRTHEMPVGPDGFYHHVSEYAWNGDFTTIFRDGGPRPRDFGPAWGGIRAEPHHMVEDVVDPKVGWRAPPAMLTVGPFPAHTWDWISREEYIALNTEEKNGHQCARLLIPCSLERRPVGHWGWRVWFDLEKGLAGRRIEMFLVRDKKGERVDTVQTFRCSDLREEAPGVWLPRRVVRIQNWSYGSVRGEYKVQSLKVNEQINESVFTIDFPTRTSVTDERKDPSRNTEPSWAPGDWWSWTTPPAGTE